MRFGVREDPGRDDKLDYEDDNDNDDDDEVVAKGIP